jgi:hypothetical protein
VISAEIPRPQERPGNNLAAMRWPGIQPLPMATLNSQLWPYALWGSALLWRTARNQPRGVENNKPTHHFAAEEEPTAAEFSWHRRPIYDLFVRGVNRDDWLSRDGPAGSLSCDQPRAIAEAFLL